MVRRGSLAAILTAVEKCITQHGGTGQRSDLAAAIAELRAALPPATASPGTANETKTEPRRPAE